MTAHELLEAARKAKRNETNKIYTEKWLAAADELRRKNWSWLEIYEFLKAQGENVQKHPGTFISAMSRRYRSWLDKQADKQREAAWKAGRK